MVIHVLAHDAQTPRSSKRASSAAAICRRDAPPAAPPAQPPAWSRPSSRLIHPSRNQRRHQRRQHPLKIIQSHRIHRHLTKKPNPLGHQRRIHRIHPHPCRRDIARDSSQPVSCRSLTPAGRTLSRPALAALSVITVHIAHGLPAPTISPVLSRSASHVHEIVSITVSSRLIREHTTPCRTIFDNLVSAASTRLRAITSAAGPHHPASIASRIRHQSSSPSWAASTGVSPARAQARSVLAVTDGNFRKAVASRGDMYS